MPFTNELIVKPSSNVYRWKLYKPLTYKDNKLKITVNVPEGFATDFASVPRPFWSILPPWGRYGKAAVVHDYLYRYGKYDRKTCDLIFLHAMEELGVVRWKRIIMYWAVRLFGGLARKVKNG